MPEFARNLAVVIGINHYTHGISPLETAVNDGKKLIQILRDKHGYQVWALLDEIATFSNLNYLLEKTLAQQVKPDDRLLFYFAGHGIALDGDDGAHGYLIPQDAKLGDTSSYLSMHYLQECLSKLSCRHFLGVLDCCFAGAFRWSSNRDLFTAPEVIHQVSGSNDKTIKLCNAATGKKINTLKGHRNAIRNLSLSDDGQLLASASEASRNSNGELILWNVKILSNLTLEDLMEKGCNRVRDYLQNNPNVEKSDRDLCDDVPKVSNAS